MKSFLKKIAKFVAEKKVLFIVGSFFSVENLANNSERAVSRECERNR